MRSLAAGAILVGITSVLAALTLLPALLGLLRDGVNRLRIPFVGAESARPEGRFWGAIVDARAPPPGARAWPPRRRARAGRPARVPPGDRHLGRQHAPGRPRREAGLRRDPARLQRPERRAGRRRGRERLGRDAAAARGPARPARGRPALRRGAARGSETTPPCSNAPVRGDEVSDEAVAAVRDLRETIVPEALAGAGGVRRRQTSENIDYFDAVTDPAPLVFAFVLGLTFALLTVAFRSVTVAAQCDRAQPALGRRRLRPARARVPGGRRRRPARLPAGRRDRGVGAAVPVLRALRALDGLPGLPAQPDPRALRRRRATRATPCAGAWPRPRGSSPARR